MRRLIAALMLLASFAALAQTGQGPPTLQYPTTAGNCVTIKTTGSGVLSNAACGGTPSGAAGGDLSGTYPNPTVVNVNGVAAGTAANANLGTSGIALCLLSSACTWSTNLQTFQTATTASNLAVSSMEINNTAASNGQTSFDFRFGGTLESRIRADSADNEVFVVYGAGIFYWFNGGDYLVGTNTMSLSSSSLTLGVPLKLPGGTLLSTSAALTNGAASAVGTLTNGPTAGNPTKWIPINDNGTTRYIPAW